MTDPNQVPTTAPIPGESGRELENPTETPKLSQEDEDLVDWFLNGMCGSYAVAAASVLEKRGAKGVGISLLFDDEQEPNTTDGRGAIHAYASCDEYDADAAGVREPVEMAEEYGIIGCGWDVDGPYSPPELAAMFEDQTDIGIHPEAIAIAEAFIERNPHVLPWPTIVEGPSSGE